MNTRTYSVKGMTCGHCVRSVTSEVSRIPGVTGVGVDLATGQVTVETTTPIEDTRIHEAVDEAGYEVVNQP
jgi:copper chaperone